VGRISSLNKCFSGFSSVIENKTALAAKDAIFEINSCLFLVIEGSKKCVKYHFQFLCPLLKCVKISLIQFT
jgi:hypothetical protein